MGNIIFDYLAQQGLIEETESAKAQNEITIEDNRPTVVLKGNRLGLIMLADYLVSVALSKTDNHHIHLDMDNFFDKGNAELIIVNNQDL